MNRNAQLTYLVLAMIAAGPQAAEAATVVRTTASSFNLSGTSSGTITFADVISADQLVSISSGSVSGPEGGSMSIAVNYSGGSSSTVFTQAFQGGPFTYNLASVPTSSFAPGTVTGLTFMLTTRIGIGPFLTIPSGTDFTFRVPDVVTPAVPEPATWMMMVAGFGALGASMRLRRSKRLSFGS